MPTSENLQHFHATIIHLPLRSFAPLPPAYKYSLASVTQSATLSISLSVPLMSKVFTSPIAMEKETHAKPSNKARHKKKNGLLQRHSVRKPAAVSPASRKSQWKSLVGAMRPLQHDNLPHSPPISAGSSSPAAHFTTGYHLPPRPLTSMNWIPVMAQVFMDRQRTS